MRSYLKTQSVRAVPGALNATACRQNPGPQLPAPPPAPAKIQHHPGPPNTTDPSWAQPLRDGAGCSQLSPHPCFPLHQPAVPKSMLFLSVPARWAPSAKEARCVQLTPKGVPTTSDRHQNLYMLLAQPKGYRPRNPKVCGILIFL